MNRSEQWKFMDNLKRKLYLKFEIRHFLLKSLQKNSSTPLTYRYYIYYQKIKLPRWSSLPQLVNRCAMTGRSMSVSKHTHYSRFVFRTKSYKGEFPGYRRASW